MVRFVYAIESHAMETEVVESNLCSPTNLVISSNLLHSSSGNYFHPRQLAVSFSPQFVQTFRTNLVIYVSKSVQPSPSHQLLDFTRNAADGKEITISVTRSSLGSHYGLQYPLDDLKKDLYDQIQLQVPQTPGITVLGYNVLRGDDSWHRIEHIDRNEGFSIIQFSIRPPKNYFPFESLPDELLDAIFAELYVTKLGLHDSLLATELRTCCRVCRRWKRIALTYLIYNPVKARLMQRISQRLPRAGKLWDLATFDIGDMRSQFDMPLFIQNCPNLADVTLQYAPARLQSRKDFLGSLSQLRYLARIDFAHDNWTDDDVFRFLQASKSQLRQLRIYSLSYRAPLALPDVVPVEPFWSVLRLRDISLVRTLISERLARILFDKDRFLDNLQLNRCWPLPTTLRTLVEDILDGKRQNLHILRVIFLTPSLDAPILQQEKFLHFSALYGLAELHLDGGTEEALLLPSNFFFQLSRLSSPSLSLHSIVISYCETSLIGFDAFVKSFYAPKRPTLGDDEVTPDERRILIKTFFGSWDDEAAEKLMDEFDFAWFDILNGGEEE
ncbi:hypothetical protein BT69DRAFT_208338 [Atractiella rhizophila]|nr:hypothetical protein BT69DRAFT_208338 [Atractiella rhizophila]